MPRRAHYERRDPGTDPRYNHPVVARFINKIMQSGKKSTAERIVYTALDTIESQVLNGKTQLGNLS